MIAKLRKVFYETDVTWKKVIVMALICGVVIGLLMCVPFLDGSSLQQPGVSFEFWILAAIFIILNSEKPLEAGLKTFVFFLISQPVIYLVQVPFSTLGWRLFMYYPRWAVFTVLTLPGGMIAWYVKKETTMSVLILTVANILLCISLPGFVMDMARKFPYHLLTVLFIAAEIIMFILIIFQKKDKRVLAFIAAGVLIIGGIGYNVRERAQYQEPAGIEYSETENAQRPMIFEQYFKSA